MFFTLLQSYPDVSLPAKISGDIITDLQIAASISAPDLLVSKPSRWWVSNGSITSETRRDNSSGFESNFQESQPKGPGQVTRDSLKHRILPSATRTMKNDGDILQNMNEQVSDLPLESQPVNVENLKGTAEKPLREVEAEDENGGDFKEPHATNHDRMLTEEGGDVFEKHIVSEIQQHKSVVFLQEESDEMCEKQVGSSSLELVKKVNEKGASATLQILGRSMLDHIQVFMITYLLVLISMKHIAYCHLCLILLWVHSLFHYYGPLCSLLKITLV